MTEPTYTDSAGNERTEEQVKSILHKTLSQMSVHEIVDLLDDLITVAALPDDLTKCDCHGLWYDECEAYR